MPEKISNIFPSKFEEQQQRYKGHFSSRAIHLSPKWCRGVIDSRHCKRLFRTRTNNPILRYLPFTIRKPISKEEPLSIYHIDEGSKPSVVIKKISYRCNTEDERKERKESATNEILAGNLRHIAILPLLGMAEDPKHQCYYLVFPYMCHRDVRHCLDEKVDIDRNVWKRILYQISCALVFLHTEVDEFRGKISHGDVTSTNILLDEHFNARLGDFGQSREYGKGEDGKINNNMIAVGTPGYYDEDRTDYMNLTTDIIYFGIVFLEILTGCKPAIFRRDGIIEKPLLSKSEEELLCEYEEKKNYWGHDTFIDLMSLAIKCRNGELKAEEVCKNMNAMMRNNAVPYSVSTNDDMCQLCLMTVKVEDAYEHTRCELNICVNCLKNSSINPITCFCQESIHCPIGYKTWAIFIVGHWKDKKAQRRSVQDAKAVKEATVTRHPLAIGIREEDTHTIYNLDEMSDLNISDKYDSTLVIYYSGEADRLNNLILSKNGEANGQEADMFRTYLKHPMVSYVKCIFDCCNGPDIGKIDGILVSQLKACQPCKTVEENYDKKPNSRFTTQLLHALQGHYDHNESSKSLIKACFNISNKPPDDGLMSLEYLRDMIKMGDVNATTQIHGNMTTRLSRFAFHNQHTVAIKFLLLREEETPMLKEYLQLPINMNELLNDLLKAYKENDERFMMPVGYSEVLQLSTDYTERKNLELTSLLQVENAHGRHMTINVRMRKINDIPNGKVAVFPNQCSPSDIYQHFIDKPELWTPKKTEWGEFKMSFEIKPQWTAYLRSSKPRDESPMVPSHLNGILNILMDMDLEKKGYKSLVLTFVTKVIFEIEDESFTQHVDELKTFYFMELLAD